MVDRILLGFSYAGFALSALVLASGPPWSTAAIWLVDLVLTAANVAMGTQNLHYAKEIKAWNPTTS